MLSPVASVIACRSLTIRVPGRTLVEDLDLAVASGEFVAVLGQNGAGKTRTMHTLAGLLPAGGGEVQLGGRSLAALKRQEVARRVSLLPQYVDDVFPATVMETVLIGRHPHIGALELESATDREIASRSLQL